MAQQTAKKLADFYEVRGNASFDSGNGLVTLALDTAARSVVPAQIDLSGYASQSYVDDAITSLIDTAPGTLDTLNELAAALGDDANFAATVTTALATKITQTEGDARYLQLSGGTLTGQLISNLNGAASAPPVAMRGTWFTGGTGATTKPQILVEPTGATSTGWNSSGTGLGVNAVSGFGGNLADFQLNGQSRLKVDYTGFTTLTAASGGTALVATDQVNSTFRLSLKSGGVVAFASNNTQILGFGGMDATNGTFTERMRLNNSTNQFSVGVQTLISHLGSATNDSTQAAILGKPSAAPSANYQFLRQEPYNSTTANFSVDGSGNLIANSLYFAGDETTGFYQIVSGTLSFQSAGVTQWIASANTVNPTYPKSLRLKSNMMLGWSSDNPDAATEDVALVRDGAGALKITNGDSGLGILRMASLGIGNSAAATTPGTVTHKMEIFDASGASLGFVAIFDAIT